MIGSNADAIAETGGLVEYDARALAPVAQVDGDSQLLELWLHGRSPHTQRAYRTDVDHFLGFVRKPLRTVTVGDVQAWMDTLEEHLAPGSRARKISSVKSLFGFGHRLGSPWEPGVYSTVRFTLEPAGDGTRLVIDHIGIPTEWIEHISLGYPTFYKDPITKFFANE